MTLPSLTVTSMFYEKYQKLKTGEDAIKRLEKFHCSDTIKEYFIF